MSKAADDLTKCLMRVPSREVAHYGPHQPIFRLGDDADDVYYVTEGRVSLTAVSEHGKEALIGIIMPGQFFGHVCVLKKRARTVTATAMAGPVKVIVIKAIVVLGLLDKDKRFSHAFMLDLVHRLDRVEADLIDQIVFGKAKAGQHLARTLLQMADAKGFVGEVTHGVLAKKIGMTRSRIGNNMREFRRHGLLDWDSEHPHAAANVKVNLSAMSKYLALGRGRTRK